MIYLFIIILFFIILVIGFSNDKQKHNNCHCGQSTSTCSMPPPRPNEPVVQELQYFCVKDKGYHVSVWPKDSNNWLPGLDYVEFNIAGLTHRDNIDNYFGEHAGKLESEPTNPYDVNAIKILAEDGHHVGYVPKDMTSEVRKNSKLPCRCYFYIGENDGFYFSDCYIKIKT